MNVLAAHPQSAQIVAALPLRRRSGLYVHPEPDSKGSLTILDRCEDASDGPSESIVGLALHDDEQGWYLGCIECRGEIEEADGGMCRPCREDLDRKDLAYIPDEPEEPLPAQDREDF
jgi:hypothetical protein